MAAKKFIATFTVIVLLCLAGAGIALIEVIEGAEARAAEEAREAAEQGTELPSDEYSEGDVINQYVIKPFNTLVMVRDKVGANTDAIMLININPYDSKISVMSIPRDTIVSTDVNRNGEDDDIINMVYAAKGLDVEQTTAYIGSELGCSIKYGVVMQLKVFSEVIDALGPVTFDVPYHMEYDDPYQNLHIYFEKGLHQFDGEDAEKLLRHRKNNEGVKSEAVNGSDIRRIKMQQDFLKAVIEQKTSLFHMRKLREIINIVFDNLNTDAQINDFFRVIPEVLKIDLNAIEWFTLPVRDDEDFIHLIPEEEEIKEIIRSNFIGYMN